MLHKFPFMYFLYVCLYIMRQGLSNNYFFKLIYLSDNYIKQSQILSNNLAQQKLSTKSSFQISVDNNVEEIGCKSGVYFLKSFNGKNNAEAKSFFIAFECHVFPSAKRPITVRGNVRNNSPEKQNNNGCRHELLRCHPAALKIRNMIGRLKNEIRAL